MRQQYNKSPGPKEPNVFAAGQAAANTGKPRMTNPYRAQSREWVRWDCGWQSAASATAKATTVQKERG